MDNNRKHLVFAGALITIVLVIGGLIYQQEKIIQEGSSTILATRPIDPRDLFRGEYVILRYAIEADERVVSVARGLEEGTRLYIKLTENSAGIAEVDEVQTEAPLSYEGLWIISTVTNRSVRFPEIEQFYVPEGAGTPIEELRDELHVEVVLNQGEARVVTLLDASLNPIDAATYIPE